MPSSPLSIAFHSSWLRIPAPNRPLAWARLARTSTSRRTASTGSDRFIFSKTGSWSSSNRPCQSFILLQVELRSNGCRESEEVDESFGVVLVVIAGIERRDIGAVETVRRRAALHRQVAFVKPQRDGARHDFLSLRDERVESFAQRREPVAFVDKLGVSDAQNVFVVTRLAVETQRLELAMRRH